MPPKDPWYAWFVRAWRFVRWLFGPGQYDGRGPR